VLVATPAAAPAPATTTVVRAETTRHEHAAAKPAPRATESALRPAPPRAAAEDDATVGFQVARHNHAGVRDCWLESSKTTSVVTVTASVDANGAVVSASASAADAGLARCVEAKARAWSFPPSSKASRSFRMPIRLGRN
jgi:hypothetical protein